MTVNIKKDDQENLLGTLEEGNDSYSASWILISLQDRLSRTSTIRMIMSQAAPKLKGYARAHIHIPEEYLLSIIGYEIPASRNK